MKEYRIGAVVGEFNYDITMMMMERAKAEAEFLGVKITKIFKVPGVFDMPLAIKTLLEQEDVDAVITLGAVIKGETDHDELIAAQAARKITDLALDYNKPVALGVSGPGETQLMAVDRIEKGRDAVDAVVKMLQRLEQF